MLRRLLLAVTVPVLVVVLAPPDGALGVAITGASYSFAAAAGPASSARGRGELEKTGDFLAVVRGRAGARTFAARVLTWSIDRRTPTDQPGLPKTTLVLRVTVTSSVGGCPAGTRGTVVLVDWNRRSANGRRSDRVSVRFPPGSCHAFARGWSNVPGGRARVEIAVRA